MAVTETKMRILVAGIKMKLARGAALDEVLKAYVSLTEDEKTQLRERLAEN